MEKIMKTLLKKKIENALAKRQEPKGYGSNPEELETVTYNYIYVVPDELNQIVRSRKCEGIILSTQLGGYTEEGLKNDEYYPHAFSVRVRLTKKTAKGIISDFYEHEQDKLIKVFVSRSYFDESKFKIIL
jgi:hypothetical protein